MRQTRRRVPPLDTLEVRFSADVSTVQQLVCPRCGDDYIHQRRVRVFDRPEDAKDTLVVTVGGATGLLDVTRRKAPDNPSARRDGLTIQFWCEPCDAVSELTIA